MKKLLGYLSLIILSFLLLFTPSFVKADTPESESFDSSGSSDETAPASYPSIDWSQYTYDDLLVIRDSLNTVIGDRERQYAIENGNRIITLNESDVTLYVSKTVKLEPDVKRVVEDAPEKNTFVWKSSDESIAKVSNAGVVTGVSYGDAVITCTASDDEYVFTESLCHVVLPVSGLTLDQSNIQLLLSDQDPSTSIAALSCTVDPDNAYVKDVSWSSSNPDIVMVDEAGVLHAVAPGTTTITVRSDDPLSNTKTATCRITVLQAVSSITLSDSSLVLNVNASANLKASIFPENASKKTVSWESSDPSVITVSNSGSVRALSPGTATIKCTSDDGSNIQAACTITCIQMVNSVKIDSSQRTINLSKGKTNQLKTIVLPENATDKNLNWSSSDPKIVSVSSSGKIQAVSGGAATITCTSTDGSEKSASIEVFVPSIAVNLNNYSVVSKNGLEITIKYYGRSSDFSYDVSPSNIFSVTARKGGESILLSIAPKRAGTATITLKDKSDRRSDTKLTVTVQHSACYDSTSYPTGSYSDVLRYPSSYKNTNMSIYGKVLQVSSSWSSTILRVATRGGYNDVFYIVCPSDEAKGIIEDDYITVYGVCTGTETYTSIMGASITIPSIKAEKIYIGRK